MSKLKEQLFTNWHLMRIVRLALGIMILVMGIQTKDWVPGLFSIFFLYQAITDTGCCGANGCYVPKQRKTTMPIEIVEYEEIKQSL
ncbi:MAG: hypothetical protein P4L41_14505 [Flavipsychrobacter sp.]|nr:hypothetical protein [Flavipsychrobacter sp.]